MRREQSVFGTLTGYFFTRFFENDSVRSQGETLTTVVRSLAIVAAPGLMAAFFLQNAYNAIPGRSTWGRIEDHYLFVLYSLLAMAGVAVFEWGMLFPDKLDFLVLSPLPIKSVQMLAAKASALALFLSLFLFAANLFGTVILPLVSRERVWPQLFAYAVAVGSAGVFGALALLGAGGVMLCVLPSRMFRLISPVLQGLVVMALGLMFMHYVRFGDDLEKLLHSPVGVTNWMPSFWFLGLYERMLRGPAAASFSDAMMRRGVWALMISLGVTILTYPLAWKRMRRMAVEGSGGAQGRKAGPLTAFINRFARFPQRRAVMQFITLTLRRDARYHVYLSIYCGLGLTLAIACAVRFTLKDGMLFPVASQKGLREVVPLLLFWVIAGLRMTFAVPLSLPARWIFRMTGAARDVYASATRGWVSFCGICLIAVLLPVLYLAGLLARATLVQFVCGACLCVLMAEGLLFSNRGVPFTEARSPERTSLPLMLTLFIGILPPFVFGMAWVASWIEQSPLKLLICLASVPLLRWVISLLRQNSQARIEDENEEEGEFQLLGLSAD